MKKWTKEEDYLLVNNYQLQKQELLKLFPDRTPHAINIRASKLNLKKEHNEYVSSNLSILLNESLESYYWVGFIIADGHISKTMRLVIGLSIKDYDHLYKLAKYLKSKIRVRKTERGSCILALQDKVYISQLIKKFDIHHCKTYNPPKNTDKITDDNLFLSLICGFIDGDGRVNKQYKRKDCIISIHLHSSWMDVLNKIMVRLNKIFSLDCPLGKIGNDGYYILNISNSLMVTKLKKFVLNNKLPVLRRKWDMIDESYISIQTEAKNTRLEIKRLLLEGLSISEISQRLNKKYSTVYAQIKKYNLAI